MKKIIPSIALAAALAMGTVPAFAASATGTSDPFSDNGSTEIKGKVDSTNPNVKATVPLVVTVVFGANGQSAIQGPSNTANVITNAGNGPIKVVDVELTGMNTSFTSTKLAPDYTVAGTFTQPATGNHLMFTYTTAQNSTYLTTDHKGSQAVATGLDVGVMGAGNAKAWTQETIAKDGTLGITLAGRAFFNSAVDNTMLTDALCSIKYTIAAAS